MADDKFLKDITFPQEVQYMTEQEEARARLKASIDTLTQQVSLQTQMQKEPLKMLGGASAVGGVVGLLIGRQFRRSKKIYVDAESPMKHQKALMKAQSKHQGGGGAGGALIATLGTIAFKQVMDKVITPRLEEVANGLMEKAGQPGKPDGKSANQATLGPVSAAKPLSATQTQSQAQSKSSPAPVESFIKRETAEVTPPAHAGVVPMPESKVEAKAVGTPIAEAERLNPNAR